MKIFRLFTLKFFHSDTLEDIMMPMPLPRRNSIDFSKEINDGDKKFENQQSDFSHRRLVEIDKGIIFSTVITCHFLF
jgi:hypothetical protein